MKMVLFVLNVKAIIYHPLRKRDGTAPDVNSEVDLI
jgi:hypothetical protein